MYLRKSGNLVGVLITSLNAVSYCRPPELRECIDKFFECNVVFVIGYVCHRFYVGCDLCNNWFHGECVGITEEMSKSLTEFVCTECRHARDTQELYCLCKQPYDESQ